MYGCKRGEMYLPPTLRIPGSKKLKEHLLEGTGMVETRRMFDLISRDKRQDVHHFT
jgi:hypothetical protein